MTTALLCVLEFMLGACFGAWVTLGCVRRKRRRMGLPK
jgi:hypothetical protein